MWIIEPLAWNGESGSDYWGSDSAIVWSLGKRPMRKWEEIAVRIVRFPKAEIGTGVWNLGD